MSVKRINTTTTATQTTTVNHVSRYNAAVVVVLLVAVVVVVVVVVVNVLSVVNNDVGRPTAPRTHIHTQLMMVTLASPVKHKTHNVIQGGQKSGHPRNSMFVRFFGPPCTIN